MRQRRRSSRTIAGERSDVRGGPDEQDRTQGNSSGSACRVGVGRRDDGGGGDVGDRRVGPPEPDAPRGGSGPAAEPTHDAHADDAADGGDADDACRRSRTDDGGGRLRAARRRHRAALRGGADHVGRHRPAPGARRDRPAASDDLGVDRLGPVPHRLADAGPVVLGVPLQRRPGPAARAVLVPGDLHRRWAGALLRRSVHRRAADVVELPGHHRHDPGARRQPADAGVHAGGQRADRVARRRGGLSTHPRLLQRRPVGAADDRDRATLERRSHDDARRPGAAVDRGPDGRADRGADGRSDRGADGRADRGADGRPQRRCRPPPRPGSASSPTTAAR